MPLYSDRFREHMYSDTEWTKKNEIKYNGDHVTHAYSCLCKQSVLLSLVFVHFW